MPFLKDAWSGIKNPQRGNPGMTQLAQQLMMGGGATGPIARALNKLAGGLGMMQNNRGVANQRKGLLADREAFANAMMPTGKETIVQGQGALMPGTAPGAGLLAPSFNAVTGESTDQQFGPEGTGPVDVSEMSPAEAGHYMVQKEPDIYKAMQVAWKSEDPALQETAMKYMQNVMTPKTLDPKDYFFTTPQGAVVDRRKLNSGSTYEEAAVFNPVKDQKYLDTQKLGNDLIGILPDGSPKLIYRAPEDKKDRKTQVVWTAKDGDESGLIQEGKLIDSTTGDLIKPLGDRLQPGAGQGTYKPPTSALSELEKSNTVAELTFGRINDMTQQLTEGSDTYDPELEEVFQFVGKTKNWVDGLREKTKGVPVIGEWAELSKKDQRRLTKLSQFTAEIERNAALMIKSMTGAAMTEKEAVRLLKGIGNTSDSLSQFVGKANAALKEFQSMGAIYQRKLQESGKEVADAWVTIEGNKIIDKYETDQESSVE